MDKIEFILKFKERVVNEMYFKLPEGFRKSDFYKSLTLDEKFCLMLKDYNVVDILEDIIGDYWEEIEKTYDIFS